MSIRRSFFLESFIQSVMILDLQTGPIIEIEQDIWFIYGCWPHPSSYEFFFKTTLLIAATYLGKKKHILLIISIAFSKSTSSHMLVTTPTLCAS